MNRPTGFVLTALTLALVVGAGLSALASGQPDGLESAVARTQCSSAPDVDACLDELAGEPAVAVAPAPLDGYATTWLSGVVGVVATFAVTAGALALVRAGRRRRGATSPPGA